MDKLDNFIENSGIFFINNNKQFELYPRFTYIKI